MAPTGFGFRQIDDAFHAVDDLKPGLFDDVDQFARTLNFATRSQAFDAGTGGFGNLLKGGSANIDRAIEFLGLDDAGAAVGGFIGNLLGHEEAGRSAGAGLARGLVDFAPAIIGTVLTGGAGAPVFFTASGALAGVNTYEKTDSVTKAAITGALTKYVPGIFGAGQQVGLRTAGRFGAGVTAPGARIGVGQEATKYIANTFGQRLAGYGGGQIAAAGAFELGNEIGSLLEGEGLYNPFTHENIVANVVGQIPLAVLDVPYLVRKGTPADAVRDVIEESERSSQGDYALSSIPDAEIDVTKPQVSKDLLDQSRLMKAAIDGSDALTPEQKDSGKAQIDANLRSALHELPVRTPEDLQKTLFGKDFALSVVEPAVPDGVTPAPDISRAEAFAQQQREQFQEWLTLRPKDLGEAQEHLETVNGIRRDIGQTPVSDEVLAAHVDAALTDPIDATSAAQLAVQAQKNRTQEAIVAHEGQSKRARKKQDLAIAAQERVNRLVTEWQGRGDVPSDLQAKFDAGLNEYTDALSEIDKGDNRGLGKDPEREINNVFGAWLEGIETASPATATKGASLRASLRTALNLASRSNKQTTFFKGRDGKTLEFPTRQLAEVRARTLQQEAAQAGIPSEYVARTTKQGKHVVVESSVPDVAPLEAVSEAQLAEQFTAGTAQGEGLAGHAARQSFVDVALERLGDYSDAELTQFYGADGALQRRRVTALLEATVDGQVKHADLQRFLGEDKFKNKQEANEWIRSEDTRALVGELLDTQFFGTDPVALGEAAEFGPTSPLFEGTADLMQRIYSRMGLNPESIPGYVEESLRVANVFEQVKDLQIGEVKGVPVFGAESGQRNAVFLAVSQFDGTNPKVLPRYTLGHELYHSLERLYSKGKLSAQDTAVFDRVAKFADGLTPTERGKVLDEAMRELVPQYRKALAPEILGGASLASGAEVRAHLGSMVALAITTPKNKGRIAEFMTHMPKPIADLFEIFARFARQVVGTMRSVGRFGQSGFLTPLSSELRHSLNEFHTQLRSLAKTEQQLARDVDTLMRLQALEPAGFRALQRETSQVPLHGKEHGDPTATKEVDDLQLFLKREAEVDPATQQKVLRRGLSAVAKIVEPMHQLAARKPEFADMIHLMSDSMSSVASNVARIKSALMTKLDSKGERVTTDDFKHLEGITNPGKVKDVFDNLARWQNEFSKVLDFEDPYVKSQLDKLSPEQRNEVLGSFEAVQASLGEVWNVIGRNRKAVGELALGTTILARIPELRAGQAHELGRAVWGIQEHLQSGDPARLVEAQKLIEETLTKLPAEAFGEVSDMAKQLLETNTDLMGFLTSRPWYMSERRFGEHQITYQIEGAAETGRVSGSTRAKAEAEFRKATKGRKVIADSKKYERLSDRERSTFNATMLQKVREVDQQQQDILRRVLAQVPDGEAVFAELQPHLDTGSRLQRDIAARDLAGKPGRQLREGRQALDMFNNHVQFIDALVRSEAHKYLRYAKSLHVLDPELRTDPDTLRQAKSAIDNFIESDTALGSAITKGNFVYYLGMNFSSHLLEGAQSVFSLAPNLVANGAGILDSYRLIGKAMSRAVRHATSKGKKSLGDAELDRFMKDAEANELINNLGAMSEFIDPELVRTVNVRRLGQAKEPFTLSKILTKPLGHFADASARMYGVFTHFNARTALLAGFEQARRDILQGKQRPLTEAEYRQAFEHAKRLNFTANFSGGRAARPQGFFTTKGHARTASQALWSLQSYSMGMLATYGRMLQKGYGKGSGLTPAERRSHQKAAVQLVGTQLLAAGALGLPFVGAGIALLEQLFPTLELNRALRESVAGLAEDDSELGGVLADVTLRGLPQMLPNGPDVGSRYALGNVLGTSSYDGFSLESFVGPTASLFHNIGRGIQHVSKGDISRGVESAVPQAFKRVMQLYRDEGDVRDTAGRTLVNDLTMGEQTLLAIGFTPQRVSRLRDFSRLQSRANEVATLEYKKIIEKAAEAQARGDSTGARTILASAAAADPTFQQPVAARSVATALERRAFPIDPRTLANSRTGASASGLLQASQVTTDPQELGRLLYRKQIERALGVPGQGRLTPSQLVAAQRIDALLSQNPFLSRSEARRLLGL